MSNEWGENFRIVEDILLFIVMPIFTIGVIANVLAGNIGRAIFCLIIGTIGTFLLQYFAYCVPTGGGSFFDDYRSWWLIVIMACALVAAAKGLVVILVVSIIIAALLLWSKDLERRAEEVRLREEEEKKQIAKREREEFERAQKEKGLLKFVSYDGEERWGQPEQVRRWKELDIGLSNNFADYTPREFEKFVCDLFRKMGYNAELTPSTGDYGVDVVAQKDGNTVAIQVKKYKEGNMVGAQMVQQTLGAMWKVKADQSIIITTSGFTVYAQEQAREAPIELWDKRTLHEIVRKYLMKYF